MPQGTKPAVELQYASCARLDCLEDSNVKRDFLVRIDRRKLWIEGREAPDGMKKVYVVSFSLAHYYRLSLRRNP